MAKETWTKFCMVIIYFYATCLCVHISYIRKHTDEEIREDDINEERERMLLQDTWNDTKTTVTLVTPI